MSRMAVSAASSSISSRSAGPISAASQALTPTNHQPGRPCDPTTVAGISGSAVTVIVVSLVGVRWPPRASGTDGPGHGRVSAGRGGWSAVDDLPALDHIQAGCFRGDVVDVRLGRVDGTTQAGDGGVALCDLRDGRGCQLFELPDVEW